MAKDWKWVQRMENKRDSSEFLKRNHTGAVIGEEVGGPAAVTALTAAIFYAAWSLAPVVAAETAAAAAAEATAAEAAGAGFVAVSGLGAFAFKAGEFAGKQAAKGVDNAAKSAVKATFEATWELGRHGGAYAGAGTEAACRWVHEEYF